LFTDGAIVKIFPKKMKSTASVETNATIFSHKLGAMQFSAMTSGLEASSNQLPWQHKLVPSCMIK